MPAVTSVTNFSDGNVLTATALNAVNCGIHVYSNAAARDAAYGGSGERTLVEGEYAYLLDTNATQFYDGSSWLALGGKVAQVVTTTKTDTFSASTSNTFSDITGLSVSITPTATTSKILVLASIIGSATAAGTALVQLVRGSTAICIGTATGNRPGVTTSVDTDGRSNAVMTASINFLDSPATTSSTTYKLTLNTGDTGGTAYINRSEVDGNDIYNGRYPSTITVIEVLA